MNLVLEKSNLINKLDKYVSGQINHDEINTYAWNVIDYFSKTKKELLPAVENFEPKFWFAIWQIQHLADDEHWAEGITQDVLGKALSYLKDMEEMPANCIGERP